MPSKKWSKGGKGGARHRMLWHKTNWREIFERELRSPSKGVQPALEEEDEKKEEFPRLESLSTLKRQRSVSNQSQPTLPIYLLNDLSTLVSEAQPGSFVILDIDETIIMTRSSPSLLLTKPGVDAFRAFINKRVDDWKLKNDHCRQLQKALKDKVPVTANTVATIQALQQNGVFVCGLTARYSEFAKVTEKEFQSIGVNLGQTSPFSAPFLEDQELRVTVQNGVIYCNNQDKGSILQAVLQRFVFGDALRIVRTRNPSTTSDDRMLVENSRAELKGYAIPSEIFFVDDMYANATSVCAHLSSLAEELGIVVSCYHYVPQELAELHNSQFPTEGKYSALEERVLQKQVETFFEKQLVLSNEQARMLIET